MSNKQEQSARSLFTVKTTLNMLSMQSSVDFYMLADDSNIRELYAGGASYSYILNYVNENY